MTSDKNEFENFLNNAINNSLFKKLSIDEMISLQGNRIWEIKLNNKEETIFAQVQKVQQVGQTAFGYFQVITNMFEVDEKKEKPISEEAVYYDHDIEGAYLTQMSL